MNRRILKILTFVTLLFSLPNISLAQEQKIQPSQIELDLKETAQFSKKLDSLISERKSTLDEIEKDLSEISAIILGSKSSLNELKFFYNQTAIHWRVLADNSLHLFSTNGNLNYQTPKSLDDQEENPQLIELTKNYENLLEKRNDFIKEAKNRQFILLLKVGKYRADLLDRVLQQDSEFTSNHNNEYFADLFRELKLIPYRPLIFFYSKILGYQHLAQNGLDGALEIVKQVFSLTLFIAILFIGSKLLGKITILLNRFRSSLLNLSIQNKRNNGLTNFALLLIPYASWIILIVVFDVAQLFIKQTALAEIGAILPYFIYYFSYRILRSFLSSFFRKSFSHLAFGRDFQRRINLTSLFLGRYFLFSAFFLHLTENIVRKALVYNIIYEFVFYGIIATSIFLSALWKEEILLKIDQKFSANIAEKIRHFTLNKPTILYALPLLIIIILDTALQKLLATVGENDFIKNILSQIYRRKLESAAKSSETRESTKLTESYLDNFNGKTELNTANLIKIKSHPYEEIKKIVNNWRCGENHENSLVIYGKSGMGKTALLDWVQDQFQAESLKTVKFSLTKKITSKKELTEVLAKILEIDLEQQSLEKAIETYPSKILIMLDDCHNLFLAKRGGLEAFKLFANLVNGSSANIFWINSFNTYSWQYLFNALDSSHYFRHFFKIPRWSDEDIQKLILTKHEKSGLKMTYDSLIFDMQTQDSAQELHDLNQKFFRMLWSQSRGNPRVAMDLWISSLDLIGKSTVKIHLPKTSKTSDLVKLPNEQFFVYAAISKHLFLTQKDIIDIARLPKGVVLSSLRLGIERGYLIRKNQEYRISSAWQNAISQVLINNNFIYE